jgi:tetratricopeptide (TPR) repeat protein
MRNYFLIFFLISALALPVLLTACGARSNDSANSANGNVSPTPSVPQYTDAKTAFDEGSKFFEAGKEALAVEALKQAIAFDPEMAEAHFKLGMAYAILEKEKDAEKEFESAVDGYKKILKQDPKNAQAQFDLGRSYNKLNKDDEAEDALRAAVKMNPDDGSFNREMAAILIKLAKYSEAIPFLKKALEIDPEDARAEELMEKAQDGKNRIESGIPAGSNTNRSNSAVRKNENSANGASDSNKAANTEAPPANKKPEAKPTPAKVMEPVKPAAKPPVKKP